MSDPTPDRPDQHNTDQQTTDRGAALGRELVRVHDGLREHLAALRDGRLAPADLATHCLAFCTAVTRHHSAEDETAFPAVAALRPELAAVVAGMREDHVAIAALLDRARGVAQRLADVAGDPAALRGELDGLAAILESHFTWEERRIAAALDDLDGDPAAVLGAQT